MFTKGLPLGKWPIYCGHFSPDNMSRFFPAWQWEDFLNYNRGMDRYFSCFLDDIKVFEPSEEVYSTVEMIVWCYRWCKRTKLRKDVLVWCGRYSRQKNTENPTPYLKMTWGGQTPWKPKQALNRQRKKLNANACGKPPQKQTKQKRPRKKLNPKACGKMAALIRQANNWNQMARWKGWWKWWRKIKEKEGWKIIHYSHPIENCTR